MYEFTRRPQRLLYQLHRNGCRPGHLDCRAVGAAEYTTIYRARDFNDGNNFVMQMYHAMRQTKRTIAERVLAFAPEVA